MIDRIAFLGSSSTDGFTYPMLVRQAIAEAQLPVPEFINAGVGGNTTSQMLARIERDVISRKPSICVVQPGGNDAAHNTSAGNFSTSLRGILTRLQEARIDTRLLTLNCVPCKEAERMPLTTAYNNAVRTLAAEFKCPVGDVYGSMKAARARGENLIEADETHPNYEGYRLMSRVVLDLLGHGALTVPSVLKVDAHPGVIAEWKIRAIADAASPALTREQVATLRPQADWKTLTIPESEPQTHWWGEQTRQEGFALSLKRVAGPAAKYIGYAKVVCDRPQAACFNTGGHLQAVWLNGETIFQALEWTGYHAGKERIPVQLRSGENTVVIETGAEFFASLTAEAP